MKAVFDQGPLPPCPKSFNMAAYVLRHANDRPDKIALSVLHKTHTENWTYGDLAHAVQNAAGCFRAHGLNAGDRILLRVGNSVTFPIAYLAAIAVDLVPIPTSSQLTGREITAIAQQTKPKLIVAEDGIALPEGFAGARVTGADLRADKTHKVEDFEMGDPNRAAYIIYTSGTGGMPRAVEHAHRAIWARQMMWNDWYSLGPDDRLLHAGAFNWTYTLGTGLMDPWSVGATAVIPGTDIDTGDLPDLLVQHDISIFAAAPGVYRRVLRNGMNETPTLRHGLSAGEKLPAAIAAQWHTQTNTQVYEAFGMSECSTFISSSPTRPCPPGSLGFAQNGRRVAIVGPKGPVDFDETGIIAVADRDPGLMLGYLDAPDETAARFQGEWFLTGDTGRMSGDGAITYLGRADDMMNAGGYRVSPIEVEGAMRDHPQITDCAATEVTVRDDVSVIALFYTADSALDENELSSHAQSRLARYKQPRLFVHKPSLPRGNNNKLLRRALRDSFTIVSTHENT